MKRLTLILASLAFVFSFAMLTSCNSTPDNPEDETHHKDHDEPYKVELKFVQGHLHGTYGFHQDPEIKEVKYLKKIQTFTYVDEGNGFKLTSDSPKALLVRSSQTKDKDMTGASVYGLWITFYAKDGDILNKEFVTNGQEMIHQFFFIPQNVKQTFDGVEEGNNDPYSLYNYIYCDTDPWDKTMHKKEAKLIGHKNPIGFKGYFQFLKERKELTMSIRLMHAAQSKFDENGKVSPFNKPSQSQIQRDHWDLRIDLPTIVYAHQLETIGDEYDVKEFSDLKEDSQKLVKSIAKAYNITWQEVLQDMKSDFHGDVDHESGQLWF